MRNLFVFQKERDTNRITGKCLLSVANIFGQPNNNNDKARYVRNNLHLQPVPVTMLIFKRALSVENPQ